MRRSSIITLSRHRFERPVVTLKPLLVALVLVVATTAPAFADPGADLKNAMIAFTKLTSYHMEMRSAHGVVSADFVNPGRYHTFASKSESIVVNNTMYLKLNGAWRKYPVGSAVGLQPNFTKTLASHHGDIVVTDLGSRIVGGAALHAYGVKNATTQKIETMFLDGSGRITRIETGTTIISISRFNAPMTIQAPI
jgi:hypothetical protein